MWRLCAIYVAILGLTLLTMDNNSVYGVLQILPSFSEFEFSIYILIPRWPLMSNRSQRSKRQL